MDKLTMSAFEKMQKRENSLRVLRDRMGLGRITREEFRKEEVVIIMKYKLTEEEQRAYERHTRMQEQRKRK